MHCSNLPVFWRGSQRNMRVMKNSTFKSFVFLGADPENHFLTLIIRAAREGFDPSSIEIHPVCWSCSQFAASHLANTRPPLSPSSPTNHPTMADEEELVDYDEEVRLRRASFVPVNGAQSVRELEERIEGCSDGRVIRALPFSYQCHNHDQLFLFSRSLPTNSSNRIHPNTSCFHPLGSLSA